MPATVLPLSFYRRPTPEVARDLLGQTLCRRLPDGAVLRRRITETEAYDGFEDRASHAHRGPTPRNRVMFGPPGRAYVYLCYGVHWLLNFTTREAGYPAAVLLRGVEGAPGPGRLTRFLRVDRRHNTLPLYKSRGLWVETAPAPPGAEIAAGPRVGIDYAGAEWMKMPWRFVWGGGR